MVEMAKIQAPATGADDRFMIAGKTYRSRLIVGTGKYKDLAENAAAVEAAGAEIVTVAVRRVNVTNPKEPMLVDYIGLGPHDQQDATFSGLPAKHSA